MTAPTEQEIQDAIANAISEPASATVDGVQASKHSLSQQIAAARFLSSQTPADPASTKLGIRISRIVPPGTISP